ncbi:MAG: hypothetical protein M3Y72_14505 [Acidobacteriota bacterium]|nr:hypothetical protein [Acidobacteriota bacterium]
MSDAVSYPEKKEASELATSKFCDDWYMRAYNVSGPGTRSGILFQQWRWKKIAVAGALGVCLGLGSAAWRISGGSSPMQNSYKTAPLTSKSIPISENTGYAVRSVGPSRVATAAIPSREPAAISLPPEAKSQEVERLKTRNRRLEALVKVLRQRPAEKKSVQEQTTYLGQ